MQFTTALVSAILALSASAAPAAPAPETKQPFTSIALRSASPIHFQPLVARGLKVYLGGKTGSYCPLEDKDDCPPGKQTAFIVDNKTGFASMDVSVPGGQQLYVAPDGSLSYTQAHSAAIPPHSTRNGFNRSPNGKGEPFGYFTHDAGLVACKNKDGKYQVYAETAGFTRKGCLGFQGTAAKYDDGSAAAWQYT